MKLPTAPIEYNKGDEFTVSGWGTTSEGGSLSPNLISVKVPHVPDDGTYSTDATDKTILHFAFSECNDNYSGYGGIKGDVMICAGAAGRDSCQVCEQT